MRFNTYSFPLFLSPSFFLSICIFCFLFILHTYPQSYGSAHAYFPIFKIPISYSSFLSLVFFLSHDQHVSSSLFLSSPPTERAPRELASLLLRENSACHGEKPVSETRTRVHFLSLPVRRLRSPLLSARVTAFFSSHPVVLRARTLRYRTRPPIFVFFRYSPVRYTCCQ